MKTMLKSFLGESNFRKLKGLKSEVRFYAKRISQLLKVSRVKQKKYKDFQVPHKHTFFGYYDISPFHSTRPIILAGTTSAGPVIALQDAYEVGFFDLATGVFTELARSSAFCWQQGARLQWWGEESIIFNDYRSGKYVAVVSDLKGNVSKVFPAPLYDLTPDRKFGLSLDFVRLQDCRPGYGYLNRNHTDLSDDCPNSWIQLIDLNSDGISNLISLKKVTEFRPQPSMNGARHYFNHIKFSPDGKRFLFMHLWSTKDKRFGRLFTSDLRGNIHLLNNEGMSSHYFWKNNTEILVYSRENGNSAYYLYRDLTNEKVQIKHSAMLEDGHPSYLPGKEEILLDTYPDAARNQNLFICRLNDNSTDVLANLYTPKKFKGEFRCDLHPRIDHTGNKIAVDKITLGKRSLRVIELN